MGKKYLGGLVKIYQYLVESTNRWELGGFYQKSTKVPTFSICVGFDYFIVDRIYFGGDSAYMAFLGERTSLERYKWGRTRSGE